MGDLKSLMHKIKKDMLNESKLMLNNMVDTAK